MRPILLLLLLAVLGQCADRVYDEVINLPGVTFEVNFKHYSGYLDASPGNHLHYWFFESQMNPSKAPLVLWLNGGPGCSSISGMLTENGPFHPTRDGEHLQENVFSWNKIANVLYIDSPRDVGYSYRDSAHAPDNVYNNSKTTDDLVLALQSFVTAFPQFKSRDFYATGESYAGIYIPELVDALLHTDTVQLNLKGFAVGNGLMKKADSFNSDLDLMFYRGIIGKHQFDDLYDCCAAVNQTDLLYCDFFTNFIDFTESNDLLPKQFPDDEDLQACANKIAELGNYVWTSNDVYNTYQDCYADKNTPPKIMTSYSAKSSYAAKSYQNYEGDFYDQGANQFADSTDAMGGFQCYSDDATEKYLNLPEVRQALHISGEAKSWADCRELPYVHNENDMSDVFNSIIDSGANIRGLIYNGDLDLADSFMADQWFVERVAEINNLNVVADRKEWIYKRNSNLPAAGGGYVKRFGKGTFAMDLVLVKGAGHFVPTDRPGPALQMMSNFIFNAKNYDNIANISTDAAPLLKQFQSPPEVELFSRKEADRIYDLPGLTFKLNFHQYAGYLNGIKGNYLHYWFVESQRDPLNDPLVLWLSGGPGCSGYTALLWGNGPFRPNRDGTTVFENVYSWNKIANVIFIDSPRNVGFSFQNTTENPSTEWNDELTAEDLKLALLDFLEVYPEYKNRAFFLAGESYGGVYAPSTAVKLIELIQSGDLPYLNFQGMATGNAILSSYDNFNAQLQYQYFHGAIGKDDWESLQQCCPKSQHPAEPAYFEFCDFSKFITFNGDLEAVPKDPNDFCGQKTVNITVQSAWEGPQTQFNLYASCYDILGFSNDRPELVKPFYKQGFVDQARLVSHEISDSQDGQFCWGQLALQEYLNTAAVQAALHVRQLEDLPKWEGCSNITYEAQYTDMRPFFRKIIDWGKPFKFLIYNGDIDMTCNFLSGQWFAESIANEYNMDLAKRYTKWLYLTQIGGYAEQFAYKNITMDVVTVKGAGHFAALDRPGPTLQVAADLELADLLQRYAVEELVGREKDIPVADAAKSRAKRAAAALPPPPPACNKKDNEVIDLPGLTFDLGVKHYSGYLNAGAGDYLHYWLIEAEKDADTAPLILWFNGGPGCSSLTGLFSELGPFQNNGDGETLYENVFSWHRAGNLLFLESPRGIGFSYQASDSTHDPHQYSDTLTAENNVNALVDFLNCYPEYKDRSLYITGESYAGVYIPTFADLLLKKVDDGSVTGVNLEGLAIGNGLFSQIQSLNSDLTLTYMKGMHSKREYELLGECVPADHDGPMSTYDFSSYVHFDKYGAPIPKSLNTSTLEGFCGAEILKQAFVDVWASRNDVYNTYQDCYVRQSLPSPGDQDASNNAQSVLPKMRHDRVKRDTIGRPMKYTPFIDEAKRMNYQSTDNNGGVYCYDGKTPYLNKPEVRKAIHIPDTFTKKWTDCENNLELKYVQEHTDTTPVFESIFTTVKSRDKPLRLLIYHGDADMACQFLSGQWFIEELAKRNDMEVTTAFTPWQFEMTKKSAMNNTGGFQKSWWHPDGKITIDLVTVKGAGHMVPLDRPGETLQMFYNFIHNANPTKNPVDYNIPLWESIPNLDRKPLKTEYFSAPSSIVSRADADRVYNLPGLTFDYAFDQWSGYLQAGPGNKLFYWFFQSQNADPSAPVVLWLNGGPGCSSLIGLLTENGPFRVNPDQRTLWENVYSWNKAAHVLYIDSPRTVGFSFQNKTENPSRQFGDDLIAPDAWLAIEDFFTIFPAMKKRDFYTSGESYCGIYLPLITSYLTQKIDAGESTINLKGMIIGNGQVSDVQDLRTTPSYHYMHGIIGKDKYDALDGCCTGDDSIGGLYCHYDDFIDPLTFQERRGLDDHGRKCARAIFAIEGAENGEWQRTNDGYNLYQDCYATPKSLFSVFKSKSKTSYKSRILAMKYRGKIAAHAAANEIAPENIDWWNLDPLSTDNTGSYQCWMDDATENYLNLPHVRTALHVPDYVQKWSECVSFIPQYQRQHPDMSEQFEILMNSPLNLRVLLYNGDVDDVCQLMQAQWFVEALAHKNGWTESDKTEWHYRGVIAGYQTSYQTDKKFSLDLLTVKGAGHMVPTDRPGPALQMINAFLKQQPYDTAVPYSMERKPLLHQYTRQGDTPAGSPSPPPVPTTTELPLSTESESSTPPTTSVTVPQQPTTTSVSSGLMYMTSLLSIMLAFVVFH